MKTTLSIFVLVGLAMTQAPLAYALDDELKIGQEIYQQNCALCHGPEGNGDGEIGLLFKLKPKALSQLSKENGGQYPFELVYQTLKATKPVQGHGTAMPVWGSYFRVEKALNDPSMANDEAMIVVGRLLSLIYYIETLQEK